ncbi:MAG: complex subunit region [Alphaproteobacteria bacterium]|nr:complex subunit region [Alphaproteobacteria bacterium]
MVQARIYRPAKTAMQSGKAKSRQWILEFCPKGPSFIDPLMGWQGSTDTLHHLRLTFRSLQSAMAYASQNNLTVQVETDHTPVAIPKAYADNFRYDRVR